MFIKDFKGKQIAAMADVALHVVTGLLAHALLNSRNVIKVVVVILAAQKHLLNKLR